MSKKTEYLGDKVQGLVGSVMIPDEVARRHMQACLSGMNHPLQQKLNFVQHIAPDLGPAIIMVEEAPCG